MGPCGPNAASVGLREVQKCLNTCASLPYTVTKVVVGHSLSLDSSF